MITRRGRQSAAIAAIGRHAYLHIMPLKKDTVPHHLRIAFATYKEEQDEQGAKCKAFFHKHDFTCNKVIAKLIDGDLQPIVGIFYIFIIVALITKTACLSWAGC